MLINSGKAKKKAKIIKKIMEDFGLTREEARKIYDLFYR